MDPGPRVCNIWWSYLRICDPIQQKVHLVYLKNEIFALSIGRFNKLSNDTKIGKIEVKLLKVQHLQSVYFLLFSLYFAHFLFIISEWTWLTRCPFCCTGSHICISILYHTCSICPIENDVDILFSLACNYFSPLNSFLFSYVNVFLSSWKS